MTVNRLGDYLDHIRQATADAIAFVEGLNKEEFLGQAYTASCCHESDHRW